MKNCFNSISKIIYLFVLFWQDPYYWLIAKIIIYSLDTYFSMCACKIRCKQVSGCVFLNIHISWTEDSSWCQYLKFSCLFSFPNLIFFVFPKMSRLKSKTCYLSLVHNLHLDWHIMRDCLAVSMVWLSRQWQILLACL